MQQESQFFRALFDEAPLPYHSLDSEGRLVAVNKAWQVELGYERHEILGRWFGDFISSDQREEFRERFSRFVEEGHVQGVVWQLRRKDGSSLHVSFSGRIARDRNGRFLRTHCMFFDLSKRSEPEEQLRQAEELRMAFMESAEEGFGLFDSDLRLIYTNTAGARMHGEEAEQLIGEKMMIASSESGQPDRYAMYQRVLETGESATIDEFNPAQFGDRRFAIHAFKVGENLGIVMRDVTDAKNSERMLQESEARWRSVAEESPDHVVLLDRDLRIEYVNFPSPGVTVEQLVGSNILEYVEDSQKAFVRQTLESVLSTGNPTTYETEYFAPDGAKVSYESRAASRIVEGESAGLILLSRDVSQRKATESQIAQLLKRQTAMAQLAMDFGRAQSLTDVCRMAHEQVRELMDAEVFIISRYDTSEELIHASFVVSEGSEQDVMHLPPIALEAPGMGTQSQVIRSGGSLTIPDYHAAMSHTDTRYRVAWKEQEVKKLEKSDDVSGLPKSALLVPLNIRGVVIGVMQVQSNEMDAYREDDAELLSGLASITAVAMENRGLIREAQEAYEGVIQALATAIELRDPYTSQHQKGVARIAMGIAEALKLPEEQIRAIELAAHIHDIGKVIIPAEILSKPTVLTNAQMLIVQSHVEAAHEVLKDIPFPWPIDEIVIQHHERLDGSGYPQGISGADIRSEARILAVADIADAMMSHRPYRPAFSLQETIAELRRLRGVALDPAAVDACVALLEQGCGPKADSA